MSGAQSSWLLLQPHDLRGWSREPIVQWTHEALKEGRLVGLVHFLPHQTSLCWLLEWERLCDLVVAPKKLGLEGWLLEGVCWRKQITVRPMASTVRGFRGIRANGPSS